MTKCKNEMCQNEAAEGFPYCRGCYVKWTQERATPESEKKPTQWHNDPIVDQLMKINSNVSGMKAELKNITDALLLLVEKKQRR